MDDLIERLRDPLHGRDQPMAVRNEAADALEAKDRRIAELEDLCRKGLIACLNEQKRADSAEAELAAVRVDAERLDWIEQRLFTSHWNGVIDSGSRTTWSIAPDYRHTVARLEGQTLRAAIDAAREPSTDPQSCLPSASRSP